MAVVRHGVIRRLECCVCGEYAGRFEQHWNRDTGFGICRKCVDWVKSRGETDSEILDLYGVEGVNYAAPAPADAVLSGELHPCHACGNPTDLNLLNGKDDGTGNFNRLECQTCYGPGWAPMALKQESAP